MRHGTRATSIVRTIALTAALATIFSTAIGSSFAFADTASLDTATIASDRADYHPGETVSLSGDGWAGDTDVRIVVNDDAGQTWRRDVTVGVGAAGGIHDSFSLPTFFVATYSVTATGQQTARVARTSFTDTATYVNLDLAASGPLTYNHATGGGAFNNGTIGRGGDGLAATDGGGDDVVESLEGGDFQCGDVATFLTEIEVTSAAPAGAKTVRLTYSFLLDTTGASGLALGPVTLAQINYGNVSNGEGPLGQDTGILDDGGSTATIISQSAPVVTEPPYFTAGEENSVVIDVTDLEPNERVILRIDARIQCKFGDDPTGNLQASLDSAEVTAPDDQADTIPAGQQTVPFKSSQDVVFPGKIIVDKVTDPSGASQSFDFRVSAPGSVNSPPYLSNFSLTDAATPHDSGFIDPSTAEIGNTTTTIAGTYKVEERNIPSTWDLDSITCTSSLGGNKTLTASDATSNSFDLLENEIVTCVFDDSLKSGSVSGDKYQDTDGDGVDDGASDPPIENWNIYLFVDSNNDNVLNQTEYNAQAATVTSTSTDASGDFTFSDVSAGEYIVCEAAQLSSLSTGWKESQPSSGSACNVTGTTPALARHGYAITVAPGAESSGNTFGNFQQGTVNVLKYEDLDGDGNRNGSDAGLSGWTIKAYKVTAGPTYTLADTQVTAGAGGTASFSLDPGTYLICELAQRTTPATTGWTETEPVAAGTVCSTVAGTNAADGYSVTVASGGTYPASGAYEFGNFQQGSVNVLKYEDLNKDGNRNGSDAGLSGWTIKAYEVTAGPTYTLADTQVTGAGGTASFSLDPGSYLICELAQRTTPATTGWTESEPVAAGTDCSTASGTNAADGYPVTVVSGGTYPASGSYEFGNWRQANISVLKYEDLNKDGNRNGSDAGLSGWTIKAYTVTAGPTYTLADTQVTAAGGTASFSLDPGTYLICELAQRTTPATTGWTESEPTAPDTDCSDASGTNAADGYQVTVASGGTYPASGAYEFGNWQQGTVRVHKYQDSNANGANNSEPNLSGWTINVYASDGGTGWATPAVATQDTDANGQANFSLDPGLYLICELAQRTTPATDGWVESQPSVAGTTCSTLSGTNAADGYQVTVTSHAVLPTVSTSYEFGNYQPVKVQVTKTVLGGAIPAGVSFTFNIRSGAVPDPLGPNAGFGTLVAHGSVNTADNVIGANDWTVDAAGQYPLKPGTYQICEVIVNGFTPDFVLNGTYGTGAGQWFSPGIAAGPGYSPGENTEACFTITVASGDGSTTHTVSYTVDNTPPGMSRTIGYWKNWTGCDGGNQAPVLDNMINNQATDNWTPVSLPGEPTEAPDGVRDIRLGDRVIQGSTACKVAVDILDKRLTANDNLVKDGKKAADSPAWNAGSQLLAYELNQLLNPGSSCTAANTAAIYTRRILNKIGFTGKTNPTMTANEKTALNYYAGILDNYNNNTLLCGSVVLLKPGVPGTSYDYLP